MVEQGIIIKEIPIPEEIKSVKIDGKIVTVEGNLGTLAKDFNHAKSVIIERKDDMIRLAVNFPKKFDKALIGTVRAHINNLFTGTTYGYKYKLKIVFSHFPIRINPEMKQKRVKIENLYGGRSPKFSKIIGDVKVSVDNEDIVVEGIDREHVGQTAANMQEITKQRGKRRKSPKTFMDGLYIFEKGMIKQID
jgi:large subunit ribosomal protein L6